MSFFAAALKILFCKFLFFFFLLCCTFLFLGCAFFAFFSLFFSAAIGCFNMIFVASKLNLMTKDRER